MTTEAGAKPSKKPSSVTTFFGAGRQSSSDGGWIRDSKLGIACLAVFLVLLLAQVVTGWNAYNRAQESHGEGGVGFVEYLTTGHFLEAVFVNWTSEFLQLGSFVVLTIFLVQRGSAESKEPDDNPGDDDPAADEPGEDPRDHQDDPDAPLPVRRGGIWLRLYEHSLLIAYLVLFSLSIVGHAIGGAKEFNHEQELHGQPSVSAVEFVTTSQFWYQSFQHWQAGFLALGSIVILTIFLRQRGSPESKPVHAPHHETE